MQIITVLLFAVMGGYTTPVHVANYSTMEDCALAAEKAEEEQVGPTTFSFTCIPIYK